MSDNPRDNNTVIIRADWRDRIVRENDALAGRLNEAYRRYIPRLEARIRDLERDIAEYYTVNGELPPRALQRFESWRLTLEAVETEMRDFGAVARNIGAEGQQRAITAGANVAQEMAVSTAGRGATIVQQAWNRPDPAALEQLINYVDGPDMRAKFAAFGTNAADDLSNIILAAVAQGKGPRAIATMLNGWLLVPYSWAENTVRTAQIWSYRSATHAAYRANPEVVRGWVWWSAADTRTCPSCWAQHGTQYSTDEVLNDHHRGRCVPVPVVRGTTWADSIETGPERFARLPRAQQMEILKPAMYRAFSAGAVGWSDFSRPYESAPYGEMLRAASLRELLGPQAVRYYTR